MADTLRQHCGFLDLYPPQQNIQPIGTLISHAIPQHSTGNTQDHTMAQPGLQQQLRRERASQENLAWPTQSIMQQVSEYSQAPMVDSMSGFAAPMPRSVWDRNDVNDALMWDDGLQMEHMVGQEAVHLGPNSHLSFSDPLLSGHHASDRLGMLGCNVGPSWTLSATGNLQRVGAFGGQQFGTSNSSMSPKSFFSEPSEGGQASGTSSMANEMSPSQGWMGFGPESPRDVKQSQSPFMDQTIAAGFNPQQARQLRPMDLNVVASSDQSTHSMPWGSGYLMAPAGLPYFQKDMAATGSHTQAPNNVAPSYASHPAAEAVHPAYGAETRSDTPVSDRCQGGSSAESQAQRKEEDRLLLEGKEQGLTYKEIRKRMRHPVAESTLRGRYRSLMKPRKDRVRKPVWQEKDLKLLEEVVTSELDRLEEGGRALNQAQRLGRVPWKKVAEYIVNNGGSYHFGNSTCKKKWTEISES